jgi:hypothetical protein
MVRTAVGATKAPDEPGKRRIEVVHTAVELNDEMT